MPGRRPPTPAGCSSSTPGPWGARRRRPTAGCPSRCGRSSPDLPGIRVQLIRRHGGPPTAAGVRVFTAVTGPGGARSRTRPCRRWPRYLAGPRRVSSGTGPGADDVRRPLWLVCTNGRRDRCCAERGRPVADGAGRPLAGGDLGDHAPGWAPVRRHAAGAAQRPHPGPARPEPARCAPAPTSSRGGGPVGRVRGRGRRTRPRRRSPSSTCATPWAWPGSTTSPCSTRSRRWGGPTPTAASSCGRPVAAGRPPSGSLRAGRARQSCADPAAKEVPVLTVVGLEPAPG